MISTINKSLQLVYPWRVCHNLLIYLFDQQALACPESFTSTEENFNHLQETKEKLKSTPDEEKFDAAIQELRSKWDDVQEKIHELRPRVKVMAESYSEYEEKLQALLHWLQKTEDTFKALESVADYNEFQPLLESLRVGLVVRHVHLFNPFIPNTKLQILLRCCHT